MPKASEERDICRGDSESPSLSGASLSLAPTDSPSSPHPSPTSTDSPHAAPRSLTSITTSSGPVLPLFAVIQPSADSAEPLYLSSLAPTTVSLSQPRGGSEARTTALLQQLESSQGGERIAESGHGVGSSSSLSLSSLSQTVSDSDSSSPNTASHSPTFTSSSITDSLLSMASPLVLTSSFSHQLSNGDGSSSPERIKYIMKNGINEKMCHLCSPSDVINWSLSALHPPLRLGNSANSCYLNSVLQCLMATRSLLGYLDARHNAPTLCPVALNTQVALETEPSCSTEPLSLSKPKFCALCELFRLVKFQRLHPHQVVWNNKFQYNIKTISSTLSSSDQEDAHEFLLGLLTKMEENCLEGLEEWPSKIKESNPLRSIFGGIIRSEVTCQTCQRTSSREEPMFNLSLDITAASTLKQCLDNYTKVEDLKGANAYKCENCGGLRPAQRKSTIHVNPRILIIQLNRFSRNQKLDSTIAFQQSLDLLPYMSEDRRVGVKLYSLYATVNHRGSSCRSGHYVAFCRRQRAWQNINDDVIRNVNITDVMRSLPYLLFYELNDGSADLYPDSSSPLNGVHLPSAVKCGSTMKPRIVFHKQYAVKSTSMSNGPSTSSNSILKKSQSFTSHSNSFHKPSGISTSSANRKIQSKNRPGSSDRLHSKPGPSLPKICLKRVHSDTWASRLKEANNASASQALGHAKMQANLSQVNGDTVPGSKKRLPSKSGLCSASKIPRLTPKAPPKPPPEVPVRLLDYPSTSDDEEESLQIDLEPRSAPQACTTKISPEPAHEQTSTLVKSSPPFKPTEQREEGEYLDEDEDDFCHLVIDLNPSSTSSPKPKSPPTQPKTDIFDDNSVSPIALSSTPVTAEKLLNCLPVSHTTSAPPPILVPRVLQHSVVSITPSPPICRKSSPHFVPPIPFLTGAISESPASPDERPSTSAMETSSYPLTPARPLVNSDDEEEGLIVSDSDEDDHNVSKSTVDSANVSHNGSKDSSHLPHDHSLKHNAATPSSLHRSLDSSRSDKVLPKEYRDRSPSRRHRDRHRHSRHRHHDDRHSDRYRHKHRDDRRNSRKRHSSSSPEIDRHRHRRHDHRHDNPSRERQWHRDDRHHSDRRQHSDANYSRHGDNKSSSSASPLKFPFSLRNGVPIANSFKDVDYRLSNPVPPGPAPHSSQHFLANEPFPSRNKGPYQWDNCEMQQHQHYSRFMGSQRT